MLRFSEIYSLRQKLINFGRKRFISYFNDKTQLHDNKLKLETGNCINLRRSLGPTVEAKYRFNMCYYFWM